jgi:hypothetical protein
VNESIWFKGENSVNFIELCTDSRGEFLNNKPPAAPRKQQYVIKKMEVYYLPAAQFFFADLCSKELRIKNE